MGKAIYIIAAFVLTVGGYQNCSVNLNHLGSGFAAGGGNGDGYTGIIYFTAKPVDVGSGHCFDPDAISVIKFENQRVYLIKSPCGSKEPIDITDKIKWIGDYEAIEYNGVIYSRI